MSLELQNVSETLWIPLFGKAIETKRSNGLINDQKALDIANKACEINPKLNRWWRSLSRESQGLMIWRNEAIDSMVSEYIKEQSNPVVINLGAGLCTRYERIGSPKVKWLEIDLPAVKSAWELFNEETENHQYWTDNIFETDWLSKIAEQYRDNEVLFVAEGLFMYFSKKQVKSILENIKLNLRNSHIVFEAYSKLALMRPHPDVLRTGARSFKDPWGVQTGKDFEKWFDGITHVKDDYFLKNKSALRRVPITHKFGANIPFIAKAGKIVYLHIT